MSIAMRKRLLDPNRLLPVLVTGYRQEGMGTPMAPKVKPHPLTCTLDGTEEWFLEGKQVYGPLDVWRAERFDEPLCFDGVDYYQLDANTQNYIFDPERTQVIRVTGYKGLRNQSPQPTLFYHWDESWTLEEREGCYEEFLKQPHTARRPAFPVEGAKVECWDPAYREFAAVARSKGILKGVVTLLKHPLHKPGRYMFEVKELAQGGTISVKETQPPIEAIAKQVLSLIKNELPASPVQKGRGQWSKEKPVGPGCWWYREGKQARAYIVEVREDNCHVESMGVPVMKRISEMGGEWYSEPIPAPEKEGQDADKRIDRER